MVNHKQSLVFVIIFLSALTSLYAAKKMNRKLRKGLMLRQRETDAVNFIRLVAMRLIYGIATRLGFGENISGALNGIFVPPGVDDYNDDYGDFDFGSDY